MYMVVVDSVRYNMLMLCYTVLLTLCVLPRVPVDAIIKRDYGCSKIYSGSNGEIFSPDYPQEYPNNLVCAWAIKAPYDTRIRVTFTDFRLERSDDCFDRLIVKDGIQSNSPVIGTFCATDGLGVSLTSSGNTLLLNFVTDASLGERGIKINWESISKISLQQPTDGLFTGKWQGIEAPKDIISFDAGLQENTVWAIDKNKDIFFYDGQKWNIQPGKLQSITVGEAGIFGIYPGNQSIFWRYGAGLDSPLGYRWQFLSGNGRKIVKLESGFPGVLYGIDDKNTLLYLSGGIFRDLDMKWKKVPLNLENGGEIEAPLTQISCGMYSCFLTTKEGDVYGMTTPGNPEKAKWIHDFGNFKNVTIGYGNNAWALDSKGNIHKKDSLNNIHMMGKDWKNQYFNLNIREIAAGLTGVYALARDGSFGRVKDSMCGGFVFDRSGTISSPNYPALYPPNQSCLWVIRPKGAKIIDLNFESQFEIKASPLCNDYLTTTYPGITEPIVECGKTVVDKRIQAEQVWIEFVSDATTEGIGFKINFESADPSVKRLETTTTAAPKVTTTLPKGWEIFKPDEYFQKKFSIKDMNPYSKSILWGLTDDGQAFIKTYGTTRLIPGEKMKSLATNGLDVWAIDANNNLVIRTDVSGSKPEGDSWKVVERYTLYKKIASGAAGHYTVLYDNNELHYCVFDEKASPDCQLIAKKVKSSSSSSHGTWFIDNNDNLFFAKVVRKPDNKYDFITKNLRVKVNDVKVTKTGDVWALFKNNTLASRKGVSFFKPYGLKWEPKQIVGVKMHVSYDNVHVVLKDGRIISLIDPVRALPEKWDRIKNNVNTPYKIDAYPKEDKIDVWVLGGLNGRIPYQGTYDINSDDEVKFERRGDVELKSISVGESGVWGIGYKDLKARYFDRVTKKWQTIPNDGKNWEVIESASPINNVYAIDYEFSELYFRDGISGDNPVGTKWVYIGLSATQISSGSHATYLVTDDGALKSFSEPPTSNKLKTWLSGLKSYLNEVSNTFSVGFGGVVAFLDEDNDVVERNILLPKDELNDKIWIWGLNRGVGASDISAGPVIFGIVGNDIIAKKVTTCFGYYHNVKNSVTVRLSKTRPGVGKCTWIVTSSKPTTMNALLVRQNFQESQNCDNGGLFYSTNHASPLLGEFKEFCRNANFQEAVKGNRMFFQYMKPVPLSIDQMELKFDVLQTESGCGGTFTDNSGRVSSGKYPENYPNNQDCTTIIKADTGKVIQLTIEKMDIEYGGTACDYDYLQINNGQYPTDPLMGKFCGKKSDLQLTSSGNAVRILFKSDDSGNAKGFTLTWKIIGVTTTPVTTTQTAQAGCGGTFTSSTGKFTSQNWPQNYPTNQNCKWSITVPAGKKVTLTLEEVDIEEDQSCLYDYLIAYDGLIITDKYNEKICGRKFNYQIQSADNEMLVVFRSDSSTVRNGFTASWNTEEMTKKPTTTVPTETTPAPIVKPSDWDEFNSGYKFKKLKSDYKGVLWGIKKDDNKIYTIDRSGTPPTLVSYLSDVYTISLGKYSVQKNGAWALAGPNRDIYFFNISNYDKEPWEKVGSIDGSKNADIVTTLFHTFLIKEDGHIFYRQGITRSNPKGDQWYLSDRGNGIDEAIFGTWLIDGKGDLRFKKFGTREFVPVDKPDKYLRSNKPFTQIVTGYGNRVFAVINGELFKRDGVSFANPSGLSWKSTGVKGVRDTTNNNLGVFVILEDERMVKLEDVVCGGILTNKEGQIKYPEFQNSYTPNQYCMYYLKLNGVENIEFSQRWFELENSRGCTKDRVTIGATQNIQNGIESTAYCASGLPNGKLVVEGGEAFIEFLSDDDVNRRGFSFDYSGKSQEEPEIKECGGEFRSDTGRFQSTRYPRSYSANENCEWKIATRENTRILITFDDMNIKSRSCGQEDYLQVFDGSSSSSEILKIYCDENAPQMIRTSGNKVLIKFKTDGSSAGRGFSGNWRAEPIKSGQLGCGDTFTALSGTLRSPNFPNKYNNYADCTYLVRLKPGNKITLKFAKFNVEKSDNCDRDYVNIYNVETNGVRRLANKLCGSDLVKDFESESNKVDVEFKSDGTSSYPGFDIRYLDSDTDKNPVYPSGWNAVSGPEHMFVQLDAIVESSGAWALDSNGIVYHFSPADKKWTSANYLASDLSLTPGKYGVYALKQNGELYFRDGISSVKPAGKYWRRIIPDNNVLTVVDYGAYGELVAINKDGDVLVRQGVVPIHKPEGDKWVTVARGFKSISVGSYGYWLVDRDDNVFFAKYVSSNELDRLRLSQVNGKFRKVSAGFGGNVWAIDKNNRVFMRINVNSLNPSGSKWTEVPDLALTDIASGYDAVYGITLSGRVVRFTDTYCGGLSTSPTGSFSSPNFPLYYPANKNCLYVIRVPGYNKIDTDVVQFALESSSSCRKDYLLTSRDGQFPSNQQVQISCGKEKSNIPKVFKNKVWFEFSSDKTGEDIGFFIEWKASRDAVTPTPTKLTPTLTKSDGLFRSCGGTITEETGTIVHPNYPGRYANRRDCRYAITVRPDKVVRLIFEKIDMENADICRYDYVEVEDSFNYETKRYCQNKRYEDFISSGRSIVINFRTDQAGVRSGFKILWMSTDPVTRVTTTTLRPVTTRGPTEEIIVNRDCGKVYRDFSGYIYHPSYPMGYKNNLDCIWTVVVPRGDTISLEFQFFKLESSVNCENDFVAIYDGASDKSPLVNKYCGSDKPADYKSKKNVASVRIKTNEKKTMNGFVVLYRRITKEVETTEKEREECGSDLTDRTEGYITSPNFPNNYDNDRDCFYTVKVKENSIIKVEFIEFDIEESSQCKDDSLVIRSGGNVNSRQIGKYCGSNLPQFVRTSGNKLFVRFITNGQNNNKGFRLYWKEEVAQGCRYDETGDSGIITSPGYPNQYGYKTNCYWYITGNDRRLQIEFEDFELEDCQGDSAFDYVRIIDGTNTNGNVIGKFCGGNLPAIIKTSSNKAIIHFRTDDRVVRNGFKLRWKSVTVKVPQTLCSEDLTGTSGVITHPNYPDKYNINKDCKWRITVGVGKKIQIKIREMIIEGSSSCKYDYVQIKDGLSNGAAELGKFCGSNLPTPVSSTGNTMMVRFYSDEQYTKEGFKLEWKELDAPGDGSDGKDECRETATGSSGRISSPNYPRNYDVNKDCYWIIESSPRTTIKITFNDIDTESSGGSCYDYVELFDGSTTSSRSLGKFCGSRIPRGVLKSRGNRLLVRFYSDDRSPKKGFQLTWKSESKLKVATSKCEKEAEGVNTGNAFLRGAFTPQCRDDGFYEKKQCHSSTGYCWCVGITTGREILGTRKAPGRGSPSCVISKCEQEIMENKKRESSGPGMVGAFVPECKENGNYEKKQCHGSTGHCWCVEPVTGQEITGTRKGPGKGDPECHLSACQREEKTKSKTNILGAFIPKCKVDGSFEDKQCHGSIGHCWCVEPKTGKEVSGTRKRPGEGQPTCGLSKCQREAAEVIGTGSDIYRVKCKPDGSYYKKQCYAQRGSCWCVDQETGKEVEGTWRGPKDGSPECGDEDKCNPACPYNYEPVCGSNGKSYSNKCLFKYEKCTNPSVTLAYEGECSGVDSCNRACPFNWEPVCGSNGKSYSNPCLFKIEQCKNPSMKISYTGTCTDGNDCKQACGFNYEPVCGTDGLSYSNECVRKLAECRDPRVKLAYTGNCKDCLIVCPYDYEPVCGTDGKSYSNKCLMKNAQCKDSSIKVASNGQCGGDLSKCQQRRKDNQNLLGSFVPSCKDDGSYDEKQCHGSIGECWCVDSKTGQEVGGSRTRRGEREPNCDLSECQKERKSKNGRLGAFIPRCKSDGSYEDKQCHGSTGHCWCVNSITGTEIQGTRKGPGKGVPSCNCLSVCPYNYEPVCGSNGKTYSNQCMLKNAKCKDSSIRLDSNGQCSSSECDRKICTKEYRPMCGSDKVTYSNPCLLQKAQCVDSAVTKAYDGACRDGSATIRDNQPIYRSSHRLSGDSGIIAHPGYPTNYENGVYSTWLINADPSNKIRLYFDTFSLQSSSGCSKDYVEVYDGDKTTDRRIGKYCSTNPGWIVSTGSQMLVVFRTNSEVTNSGFYARWNTEKRTRSDNKYDICGSKTVKFDGNQIEVHSPNFNGYSKYPRNRRCVLQLTHLPNTVFQVDVVTFFLQRPTPFCRDYLSIRDGDNKNSKELGRMCGQNVVKKRLSTNDNKIFLEFVSDGMTEDRGFSIFISSSERPRTQIQFANDNQCGQTLNGPRGVITNPSSLPVSTRSSVCVWQIETTPNTQIQLKFDLINLSDDCEKSYIIVRDGKSSEASTIRQKLCGYKTDVTIASQGNNLWLEYKTPHSDIGQFVVRWSENGAKDFKCGGTVSGSNGYLTTPFYPRALDDDVFCLWIIMAEPKKRVSLTLQDTRFGPNCVRSYTIVRDGTTSGSMQLGKFCSNSKDNIVSSGNSLWVELKATCMSNKAFKAFWAQVEDTGLPGAKIVTNEKSPGLGSGGIAVKKPDGEQGTTSIVDPSPLPETVENIVGATIITNSKGVIKSPFFPKNYPHDHVKVWILRGPKPGKIRLQFTTFDIESDSHCLYDYVEIRDGGNVGAPMLGRFCGEKLPDILESSGDKLWIKFRSDSSTHASGFSADWRWIETDNKKSQVKADPNACGGVFTTGNGVITSPKFPDLYPNNLDCIYIIKPPQAKNIQLEFNTFDLEADYKCSFDYLEVKDGSQPSSPLISKLCDNKIPNAITTKNGAFWIRLKSDVTRQGQGFSASWKVLDNTVQ